jgi:hypothetical protein
MTKTMHDYEQPAFLPKSSAARARDGAILDQILDRYPPTVGLHPEERKCVLRAVSERRVMTHGDASFR